MMVLHKSVMHGIRTNKNYLNKLKRNKIDTRCFTFLSITIASRISIFQQKCMLQNYSPMLLLCCKRGNKISTKSANKKVCYASLKNYIAVCPATN